ncbi:MAG: hypothetical protein IKE69_06900 [Thermoguttaceae bacterium]|nr:hypothetical protein [Thermoguttaceae bacterium]
MIRKQSVTGAALILAALMGLGMTGCQSDSWKVRNPFEREPKPEIKSPAEMDDVQLKAPPERYTKDDYLRGVEKDANSESSLAQRGDYSGGEKNAESAESRPSEKTAMRDEVPETTQAAPGFDEYPSDAVPFAPGSIGDVDHR